MTPLGISGTRLNEKRPPGQKKARFAARHTLWPAYLAPAFRGSAFQLVSLLNGPNSDAGAHQCLMLRCSNLWLV
jgi:hypothetical protein